MGSMGEVVWWSSFEGRGDDDGGRRRRWWRGRYLWRVFFLSPRQDGSQMKWEENQRESRRKDKH